MGRLSTRANFKKDSQRTFGHSSTCQHFHCDFDGFVYDCIVLVFWCMDRNWLWFLGARTCFVSLGHLVACLIPVKWHAAFDWERRFLLKGEEREVWLEIYYTNLLFNIWHFSSRINESRTSLFTRSTSEITVSISLKGSKSLLLLSGFASFRSASWQRQPLTRCSHMEPSSIKRRSKSLCLHHLLHRWDGNRSVLSQA